MIQRRTSTELRAERIDSVARLADIRDAWQALWDRLPARLPFQLPTWLLTWWHHFHPGEIASLAIWRGDDLVGLAPLYLEDADYGRRLLPIGISLSDYLDLLIDPLHLDSVSQVMSEQLPHLAYRIDCLSLEDAPNGAAALRIPAPKFWTEECDRQNSAPILPIERENALAHVPARQRRALRMARHRSMRRGMDIRAPSEADLPAALSHLLRLHESRWHARGEPGLLVDPRVAALLVDAVPDLATEGIVRLYTMTLDRRVAGAYLGFLVDRAAYAYFGGFDPAFSYEGPGTVLMGHAIEEATREGADTFHFLRGPEPYKYAWGATERCTWRRVLRRPAAALRPWQPPAQSIA